MIKYNNSNINDWNYGSDNIVKVYRNNAVCYYKITASGGTPSQTPCFAVVDDISQYSDTEFEDVFNKADEKWYKLNNLNQYEQYGIYGSGRTITYYEGKLTVDDGYEYMYSGGSWVNLGEVSGSTITIKSPEYIEKDSSHSGKINLDYVWKTNSKMQFKFYSTNNGGGSMIGEDGTTPDNNDCRMFFASTTAYYDWGSSRISWSSNGKKNTLYEYEYGNYYIKNMATSAIKTGSTISASRTNPLYLGVGGSDRFRTYYLKFYDGDTLVKDFIPWTDMNGHYGLFDKVSLSVYNVASGTLTGSSNVTDVEVGGGYDYPLEYVVREVPPDNIVFSSMTEAEEYECPWYGMSATIGAEDYVFCEGNEWLTKYSYVEVSGKYICDNGDKYKKMQEYDRQADGTFSPSSKYAKGDLIESGSPDCACSYNFCGADANGNDVIINNGTTTLTQSNWTSPYPVEGMVGDATTTIGMYCFTNVKTPLTALTIGNTVTTIEHEAFMETSLLTTLTIPSSVTQIDFWTFTRCNGLTEVIFEGTTPPTFTNQFSGVFHDYCPPVIYVPDSAVSAYRAIDGSVWTNQTWSSNIIQPISNRP